MLNLIKKHVFGIFVGIFVLFYFAFLGLIFFAPRIDKLERGFIPCTKNLVEEIYQCRHVGIWCTVKATLKNNACDFGVVKTGLMAWLSGEQKTPWANYYFKPVLEEKPDIEDEELKAYYQEHLDWFAEMEELNKNRIELEKRIDSVTPELPSKPQQNKDENNIKENNDEEK